MTIPYLYALLSVLAVSLFSFTGLLTLSLKERVLRNSIFLFVSLAIGALLGDALIHLIPESFEKFTNPVAVPLLVVGGVLIFFVFERFLHWHHHLEQHDHTHHKQRSVGAMILLSDGLHNFTDGLIIAVSYMASIEIGIATTIAVVLHEIPQEVGDFGVLLYSGYTKGRALFLNFLSALAALLGVGVVYILGTNAEIISIWLLPIAAGGYIYIAMADLMPEIGKSKGGVRAVILQILMVLLGVGIMFGLLYV